MTSPKPLSYTSWEAVLQYMDPNQRALLSLQCPSLKTLDSILPQYISTICVEPAQITINNTTYRMGIVLQYPQGATPPKRHVEMNEEHGVQYDMDKWGFRTHRPLGAPGDFFIPGVHGPATQTFFQERYKHELKEMEEKLEELVQKRDVLHGSPGSEDQLKELEKIIEEAEAELVPFRLKKDRKDVPYVLYLQMTILTNGPDGQKVVSIERLEYNRPIRSALTYLIRRLLNRTKSYVNTVRIQTMMKTDYFWLPADMKLVANHLSFDQNCANILRAIEQFFQPNLRRPFKTVAISVDRELNYNEGILSTAGTLIIGHVSHAFLYGTIEHPLVQFDFCLGYTSFQFLISRWQRMDAPIIGTHYLSYTNAVKGSMWYDGMKSFRGHFVADTPSRGCQCLPDCVIVPLTGNAQLEFYMTPLFHPVNIFGSQCTLMLNLEVKPRRQFD